MFLLFLDKVLYYLLYNISKIVLEKWGVKKMKNKLANDLL